MSCDCDYEMPEFFRQTKHKAIKQHRCSECRSVIVPGETYEIASGKWDGRFEQYKTCPRCISLRDHVKAYIPCFCYAFGDFLSDVRETLSYLPSSICGAGFLFEAGRLAIAIKHWRLFYTIQKGGTQ